MCIYICAWICVFCVNMWVYVWMCLYARLVWIYVYKCVICGCTVRFICHCCVLCFWICMHICVFVYFHVYIIIKGNRTRFYGGLWRILGNQRLNLFVIVSFTILMAFLILVLRKFFLLIKRRLWRPRKFIMTSHSTAYMSKSFDHYHSIWLKHQTILSFIIYGIK